MTTNELSGRMDHDVGPMLQRTNQIRRAESVVHDEDDAMTMGHLGHTLKVQHVTIGIAESLGVYYFCVGFDGSLKSCEVVYFNDGVGDALCGEGVGYKVIRSAI